MSEPRLYQFPRTRMMIPLQQMFKNKEGRNILHKVSEGEISIIAKEQDKESAYQYLTVTSNPMPISDPNIQSFLELMIKEGNSNIKRYEPSKASEEKNKIAFAAIDVLYKVKNTSINDLIPVAYGSLGRAIYGKSESQVMELMLAYTQENHQAVQELFDDKNRNQNKFFVAEALGQGIIIEGYDGMQVDFNGEKLVSIAKGETAIDAVTDYFESKEGKPDRHLVAQALANKFKDEADVVVTKSAGRPKAKVED